MPLRRLLPALLLAVPLACTDSSKTGDAGIDAGPIPVPDGGFCSLPGSVIYAGGRSYTVPGATAGLPDFSWLTVPSGFCVHHYASVPNARQLRFAPGGELFVASPAMPTTSGGPNGLAAVVVVPDDNGDGFGDSVITYASELVATQGLLFANGSLYFQDGTQIVSEPYVKGQRKDNPSHTVVADITVYESSTHWPKTLDISDTGQIFVGNGGDQNEQCLQPMPFHGGILELDGSSGGAQVAMGLRNPIDVKCHRDGNNRCFATELDLDGSSDQGGREKLIPIASGDNWGFPCCATANLPFAFVMVRCPDDPTQMCAPDCSGIAPESNSFVIGNTPFGFDFVDAQFPSPWSDKVILALHGDYGTWTDAKIVAIGFDPRTGELLPSTNIEDAGASNSLVNFATGWDDGSHAHGRPTDIEMSADGRLFVSDDQRGEIFWIAPVKP